MCRRLEVNVPGGCVFLREHSEDEAAVLVRLEGGGDDDVLPRGKAETVTHLQKNKTTN